MQQEVKKILVIRLSAIGDIVLTSPVIRSLRRCHPRAEIHFLTKKAFCPLVQHNPHIDRVIPFEGDIDATVKLLKAEGYGHILDLHRNIRSRLIRLRLGLPASVYRKDRLQVLLYTKWRMGRLPARHTVERYGAALSGLACKLDAGGLEFYLPEDVARKAKDLIDGNFEGQPIAVALGGGFATKRWPREYFARLLDLLGQPAVLLGGPAERADGDWIAAHTRVQVMVAAGEQDLLTGAAVMQRCLYAISHDSGFMHIATALGVPLFSLWGSTVPEFGFSPYRAGKSVILQVEGLSCRPCSKLGYEQCPKGHFRCMKDLLPEQVAAAVGAMFPLSEQA